MNEEQASKAPDPEAYDHGPLRTYEITWTNGHVEQVKGHQVMSSGMTDGLFGHSPRRPRFTIHGEFDGHWLLVLTAPEDDVRIIRDVTAGEWVL